MPYSSAMPVRSTALQRRTYRPPILAAALLLSVAACQEPITAPRASPAVNREISSGPIGASQRQFFFLLRNLEAGAFPGTFDPSLSPEVTVCLWVQGACQSTTLGPVTLGARGAASLRVDTSRERYIFEWRTRASSLESDAVYRLIVRVGGLQLGYLDIATGLRQRDLRGVDRREFLPLRVGAPLKVAFRIEEGPPIPDGIPGRYESDPGICVSGCEVHATPWNYVSVVWGGVRLGDLGGYGEALVEFVGVWGEPAPPVPPVPAPGSVEIAPSGSWSWRYGEEGGVEIWVDGLDWGYWSDAGGSPFLSAVHGPLARLSPLGKIAGYSPTP